VLSDIAEALDEGSTTALIMLDLSAAFAVFDHPILLRIFLWNQGKDLNPDKVVPHEKNPRVTVIDKTSPDVCRHFRMKELLYVDLASW